MKKIRMLRTVTGGVNLSAGWEGDMDAATAADLIAAGHAEPFETKPQPPAAGTVRVKILESVASADYSYARGHEGYIPGHIAADLIKAGHAVGLDGKPNQAAEKAISPQAATAEKR